MSNLYRPHEAKEDQFVLIAVAAVIFSIFVSFFVAATWHGGMKYMVLNVSGVATEATIWSIVPVERAGPPTETGRIEANSNLYEDLFEVSVDYRTENGALISASFLALANRSTWQEGDRLPVLYSRLRYDLFLPVEQLDGYRVDAWIASIGSGLIGSCALCFVWTLYRWRAFHRRRRRA
ncbi:MAG: hypothetical protein AAGH60_05290 [Pseudomonadota bacterium]